MNKIIFYFCLAFFFCTLQQTESRPLNLGKAAKKLLKILGTGTYYNVSAGYNSCGSLRSDDELVVAVNRPQMENGDNPNKNPKCGKTVTIIGNTGYPVDATIIDTCPGCNKGCLDMSPALFQEVCGDLALGVCQISWKFN